MNFDITRILKDWKYESDAVLVRRFVGEDGDEKIQLRIDLGLLHMNVRGKPDGEDSYFAIELARLQTHQAENAGDDDGFILTAERCSDLQREAIQYHHRYICLLQLEEYSLVIQDTDHAQRIFEFVERYAETVELAWALNQTRPQMLMIRTRGIAEQCLDKGDRDGAISAVDAGIVRIREFFKERDRSELIEISDEIDSLEEWRAELSAESDGQ